MVPSATKGNSPERWEKLLEFVDEKLQLGLLDHLEKIASYHFEDGTLYLQPASDESYEYLTKDTCFQQLVVLATDAVKVEKVVINPADKEASP
jgi:hypothetical protein